MSINFPQRERDSSINIQDVMYQLATYAEEDGKLYDTLIQIQQAHQEGMDGVDFYENVCVTLDKWSERWEAYAEIDNVSLQEYESDGCVYIMYENGKIDQLQRETGLSWKVLSENNEEGVGQALVNHDRSVIIDIYQDYETCDYKIIPLHWDGDWDLKEDGDVSDDIITVFEEEDLVCISENANQRIQAIAKDEIFFVLKAMHDPQKSTYHLMGIQTRKILEKIPWSWVQEIAEEEKERVEQMIHNSHEKQQWQMTENQNNQTNKQAQEKSKKQ